MSNTENMVILKKVLLLVCFIPFIAALVFAVCYLASDYETLKHWYLSLNDCFYQKETWTTNFFTPGNKLRGNTWAVIGAFLSVCSIAYLYSNRKKYISSKKTAYSKIYITGWLWYAVIILLAGITCRCGSNLLAPSSDEVFSAVNCAELPAFQVLSYYMLPNNHILFNLVNHLISGHSDKVTSGRILSGIAYVASLLCIFYWLQKLVNNRVYAFLFLLPVALQFTTLGFGGLARGYSMQMFCGWLALMSYARYIKTGEHAALRTSTIFNIIGFLLVPSYLYFYLAQVLFYIVLYLFNRSTSLQYWKHQLILAVAVFLFYMPAICFSGIAAFVDNRYCKPVTPDVVSFLPILLKTSRAFIAYCFSSVGGEHSMINIILFFLPLLLFCSKKKEHKAIALFYIILWLSCMAWSCKVRYLPYQRSLAIQFSIAMVAATYTFYWLIETITVYFKNNIVRQSIMLLVFVTPLLFFSRYLYNYDTGNFFYLLYGYDVNYKYAEQKGQLPAIPAGSSIACSDESFYLFYLYRKEGYNVTRCVNGNEDYYIISLDDHRPLPIESNNNYVLFSDKITEYLVYKRKEIK